MNFICTMIINNLIKEGVADSYLPQTYYAIIAKNFVVLAKFRNEDDSNKHNDLCPLSRFWQKIRRPAV